MLPLLSTTLRHLLVREMPFDEGDDHIVFGQPTREASARWSRPALNLFLYDLRENARMRQMAPPWERGSDGERRKAIRMDAHYLLTAWGADPDDEHDLLSRALLALFRNPCLGEAELERLFGAGEVPPELLDQPAPITLLAAQNDELQKPTDLWSVMSNDLRPAISLTVTFAMQPFRPMPTRPVRAASFDFGQMNADDAGREHSHAVTGTVFGIALLVNPILRLVERNGEDGELLKLKIDEGGRYRLPMLRAGTYTLEFSADNLEKPLRRHITVPSPSYDINLDNAGKAAGAYDQPKGRARKSSSAKSNASKKGD